jgi:hypothetical protein
MFSKGPIVRITPNEVHFNDPEFIDTLYPGPGRKTDKPLWFALRTGSKEPCLHVIQITRSKKKDATKVLVSC